MTNDAMLAAIDAEISEFRQVWAMLTGPPTGLIIKGRSLSSITDDFAACLLTGDTQMRWLGPEKGLIHLGCGPLLTQSGMSMPRSVESLFGSFCDKELGQIVSAIVSSTSMTRCKRRTLSTCSGGVGRVCRNA